MKKTHIYLLFMAFAMMNVWAEEAELQSPNLLRQKITLELAIKQTLERNPQLHQFNFHREILRSQRENSDLKPAYELGVEVENFAGNGTTGGFDGAEITIALSSVIELGGKRKSRVSVMDARLDRFELERQAQTLDVLGEVTIAFIHVLATQEVLQLSNEATMLADTLYKTVRMRAQRGAASDVEEMRAKSLFLQSQLNRDNIQMKLERQKISLAQFWGATKLDDFDLAGDLYTFGGVLSFDALFEKVKVSPAMRIYASEMRLKQAGVRLAKTENQASLKWEIGVRQMQDSGDIALTAGFSMPIFAKSRNRGNVKAALAESNAVAYRRSEQLLTLHDRLFSAYSQREQFIKAHQKLRNQVIPTLEKALASSRDAYQKGRLRYQDWIATQQEMLMAKLQLIEAARFALVNQAVIEQLTSEPMSN